MRTRSWWFPLLLVLMVAVPVAEIWLLVLVADQIGFWWTVLILLVEAALGALLMRRAGRQAWAALNSSLSSGQTDEPTLGDAAFVLVGGFLLFLPGFLSDLVAVVVLLPVTRPLLRRLLAWVVAGRAARLGIDVAIARADNGNVIEGEVVEPPPDAAPETRVIRGEVEGPRS
jgi:UPF0716 protein FxsA